MTHTFELSAGDTELDNIFKCGEARRGGVIKRRIRDVERIAGREAFIDAAKIYGFQVVENGRHYVIFCNDEPVHALV